MKYLLLILCGLPLTVTARSPERLILESAYADDSDRQSQQINALGYTRALPALGSHGAWELRAGGRRLSAPAGQESFSFLRADLSASLGEAAGAGLRVNPLFGDNWSPVLGAVNTHWKPHADWYFEASAERDLVDTVLAVRDKNRVDTGTLSGDWRFWGPLTAVVAAYHQDFSDGNHRLGRVARLVYSNPEHDWLMLQLHGRRADTASPGTGYFSPARLEEYEAVARVAGAPFGDSWNLSLQVGMGEQRINQQQRNSIYSTELRARGWFSDNIGLEGKAGCSNVGQLESRAADGYRYCLLGLTLIGSW